MVRGEQEKSAVREGNMAEPQRISPAEASEKSKSGKAFLVCAYDDEEKCKKIRLEGSMSLTDFRSKSAPKDQEIIFYCA